MALRDIAGRQAGNGSRPHPQRAGLTGRGWPDPSADPYVTVLCAVALLTLGVAEPLRRRGVRAAPWLLEQQHPDGRWHLAELEGRRLVWRPDLPTSLLALEALGRSGLPDLEHSLLLGQAWLLRQQTDVGLWADPAFPDPFTTVLVLAYFGWSGSAPRALTVGRRVDAASRGTYPGKIARRSPSAIARGAPRYAKARPYARLVAAGLQERCSAAPTRRRPRARAGHPAAAAP